MDNSTLDCQDCGKILRELTPGYHPAHDEDFR